MEELSHDMKTHASYHACKAVSALHSSLLTSSVAKSIYPTPKTGVSVASRVTQLVDLPGG